MKRILLLLLTFLLSVQAFSQTVMEFKNEVKYWIWRDRLINDFMVPGNTPGCGIIIQWRGSPWPLTNSFNYYGGFDAGDEGFEMGLYLAVLATEWYIMLNSGMTTERERTELELFYELSTIDRLDIDAEKYWNQTWNIGQGTVPTEPNGFMIRDDMFEDFLSDNPNQIGPGAYQRFLYLNQGNNGTTGKYIKQSILPRRDSDGDYIKLWQYNQIIRDHPEWNRGGFSGGSAGYLDHPPLTGPREYSHDNYIGLMVGLCTIIRLLPNNVEVPNPDNCTETMNIKNHAIEILDRIIKFMWKSFDDFGGDNNTHPYFCYNPEPHCWLITNPVTGMCVKGVHWKDYFNDFSGIHEPYCNAGGAQSIFLSCRFREIHDKYCTGNVHDCTTCPFAWGTNSSMNLIIATLSAINKTTNHDVNTARSNFTDTVKRIDMYYLDLLSCVLWRGTYGYEKPEPFFPTSFYETILSMFDCGTEWDVNNLNDYSNRNLLPQMLLHNLIKIQNGNPKYYQPQNPALFDEEVNTNYPYIFKEYILPQSSGSFEEMCWNIKYNIVGSNNQSYNGYYTDVPESECPPIYNDFGIVFYNYSSNPVTVHANNNLTSSSIISSLLWQDEYNSNTYTFDGSVKYKAGNKIILKPGFKVSAGASFNAKIDERLYCGIIDGSMDFLIPCSNGLKSAIISQNISDSLDNDVYNFDVEFEIFPNPATNFFQVAEKNRQKIVFTASLVNMLGETIEQKTSESNVVIDVHNIPKGLYYVRINYLDNRRVYKVIIQ